MNVTPAGRRHLRYRSLLLAGAGALLTGTLGGVAYAAWVVSASGSSEAAIGTPVQGVVAAAQPVAALYPGGSTPVHFTVTNPNAFPVTYNAVSFGAVTVSGDAGTCDPATYLTTTTPAMSISLAAGATSTVQTPSGAITLSSAAPNACQGRTVTVATTLSGVSG